MSIPATLSCFPALSLSPYCFAAAGTPPAGSPPLRLRHGRPLRRPAWRRRARRRCLASLTAGKHRPAAGKAARRRDAADAAVPGRAELATARAGEGLAWASHWRVGPSCQPGLGFRVLLFVE